MDAMDRISELPTPIIHHIMSYLDAKQVARTSILSKRWNQLRFSFPVLDFVLPYSFYMNPYYDGWSWWRPETDESFGAKEFIKFVDASLLQFHELKVCIQKLRLHVNYDRRMFSHVDKWIDLAVRNGVKELDIGVIAGDNTEYTLPQTIYSAKSLSSLELTCCRLEEPPNAISLNSLTKLTLREVYINEKMVQKLISECLSLEDLCFNCCEGLKILSVSQAHNLKNMTIVTDWPNKHYEGIEIVVPSLQQLTLCLSKRMLIYVTMSPHLKKLSLAGRNFVKDQEFHQFISKFPLLEDLSMSGFCSLKRIKISSNRLKHLLFSYCCNLKAIEVDTPNLLSFTYESKWIPIISMNAPCPWRVSYYRRGKLDKHCYSRLKQFLGASNRIESLTISLMEWIGNEVSFNLENFRKHSPSVPVPVEEMELSMYVSESNYQIYLDGIFLICYPKTLRVYIETGSTDRQFVEWLFKQLWNRNVKCCSSHYIKCWRHRLKDTKIVSFVPYRGGESINIHDLTDRLRLHPEEDLSLPKGYYALNLDWSFPVHNVKP